jgi:hypothetical protein
MSVGIETDDAFERRCFWTRSALTLLTLTLHTSNGNMVDDYEWKRIKKKDTVVA